MTLYEFNILTEDEKTVFLWSEGLFITDKPGSSVLLYQLFDFYVEVYYEGENNKVQRLRSFTSIEQLDDYLNIVDISGVTDMLNANRTYRKSMSNPTYNYNELKTLLQNADLVEVKKIAKVIRADKERYPIKVYGHICQMISVRLITISKDLIQRLKQ